MPKKLEDVYGFITESVGFFDSWIRKNANRFPIKTPTQMSILYGLWFGNLKTQRDIEYTYGIPHSSITTDIEKLKTMGLITKSMNTRKNRQLEITDNGIKIITNIFAEIEKEYCELIKQGLINDELERQRKNGIKRSKLKEPDSSTLNINNEYTGTMDRLYPIIGRFVKFSSIRNCKKSIKQ